jgi:hypothetical protein
VSSSRGLRIIGLMWALVSSSEYFGFASTMFLNSNTILSMYFFCNSRIHIITLYPGHVCVVLCINASVLTPRMDLVRTDHPYLGVGCHSRICPITRNFVQWKSRSGAKTMRLGPDKLTISKLDNIELREIMGTTRSNLNSRIEI